jgi:hypothetical protein
MNTLSRYFRFPFTDLSKSYPALIWRMLSDNLLWHHTSFLNLQSKSKVTEKLIKGKSVFKIPHPHKQIH